MSWTNRFRCDQSPIWPTLKSHQKSYFCGGTEGFDLRRAFEQDEDRFNAFSIEAPLIFADLSRNLWDFTARELLNTLARQCGVIAHRDAMFQGECINISERRPVTHVHWRWVNHSEQAPSQLKQALKVVPDAAHCLSEMLDFAQEVRADAGITDVVNIGIGGSDLGPRLLVQALRSVGMVDGPRVHFVSNMDGHELAELLPSLRAASTLFIVASKTFTTAETIRNAKSAREWFMAQGQTDLSGHFVAISANTQAAAEFGVGRCFGFDEGVGGRFSLWSSIGLSVVIAAGRERFDQLRAGARQMDAHFAVAPIADNLPIQLALLDLWYRDLLGFSSRCIAPYHHGLRSFPAYLQQLEMESNGKRVDAQGCNLAVPSAAVTWGQVGSNGQHAFFQMLHQGTDVVPVEFVLVKSDDHGLPQHHSRLLANALAQARALMVGQEGDIPERFFPGNRPSTVLLLPDLSSRNLGALLALQEHRTFVLGSLWGVNSFDQWGVELGKCHAGPIESALRDGDVKRLDSATGAVVQRLRS